MVRFTYSLIGITVVAWTTIAGSLGSAHADGLALTVDRGTGVTSIVNPSASGSVSFDGYQITSQTGSLTPGTWHALTDASVPGWEKITPSASGLAELNLTSSSSLSAGGTISLGDAYQPFGKADLGFSYSELNNLVLQTAAVQYLGGLQLSVHILVSNNNASVESTAAVLVNADSVALATDGYTIQSASGSLVPASFTGFSYNGVNGWESASPSINGLAELNLSGSSLLAASGFQVLGAAFAASGTHDLVFQYNVVGHGLQSGDVVYTTSLYGDVNNDGFVNGLDISLISSNWLHHTLAGDANYDGVVNGLDISLISSHWLNTLGGGGSGSVPSVPEPTGIILILVGLTSISIFRVHKPHATSGHALEKSHHCDL